MASREECYAVPVYRFEKEGPSEAQHADDEASEYVRVRYSDRHGEPSLRALHSQADATDRYRFRVTDDCLGWCSYRGDEADLPIPVQHAVHAFGFGITDLDSLPDSFFDFLEANAIHERLSMLADDLGELLITEQAVHNASLGMNDLSIVLLTRAVLPDDVYWELWDEFFATHAEPDAVSNVELSSHLWNAATDSETTELLPWEAEGRLVPMSSQVIERSDDNRQYLFVDLFTEFGIHRYQFQQTGAGACVHQRRRQSRVPPVVVDAVNETGRTVTNANSLAATETPLAVAEHAAQFSTGLSDDTLIPATAEEFDLNIVNTAYLYASMAGMYLKLHDLDPSAAETLERKLCDRLGIREASQVSAGLPSDLLSEILKAAPQALREEMGEYLDDQPADFSPEPDSAPGADGSIGL